MIPAAFTLLHGFLGVPEFWHPIVHLLRPEFPEAQFHLPALPGHNRVHEPAENVFLPDSFPSAAAWYTRQIPETSPVVGIGYSMGARLTLGAALAHPSAFNCLVLISVHPGIACKGERTDRQQWEARMAEIAIRDGMTSLVTEFEKMPIFQSQASLPKEVWARQHRQRLSHHPEQIAAALPILGLGHTPAMTASLKALNIPILFISGENDRKYTQIAAELSQLRDAFHHAIIPGAGHNTVLEQPDDTATAITSFFGRAVLS